MAQKGNLGITSVNEFFAFLEDNVQRSRSFSAAGIWDDAIGAELIATIGDIDESLMLIDAIAWEILNDVSSKTKDRDDGLVGL